MGSPLSFADVKRYPVGIINVSVDDTLRVKTLLCNSTSHFASYSPLPREALTDSSMNTPEVLMSLVIMIWRGWVQGTLHLKQYPSGNLLSRFHLLLICCDDNGWRDRSRQAFANFDFLLHYLRCVYYCNEAYSTHKSGYKEQRRRYEVEPESL